MAINIWNFTDINAAVMNKEVVENCMTKELNEIPQYLQEQLG